MAQVIQEESKEEIAIAQPEEESKELAQPAQIQIDSYAEPEDDSPSDDPEDP